MQDEFYFRSVTPRGLERVQRIRADTFEIAKELAINKYSHIKHYKQPRMDLVTAIDRAKKASLSTKKAYFIIVDDEDGECSIGTAPIGTVTHKYVNGEEDKTYKVKPATEKKAEPEEQHNKPIVKTKKEVVMKKDIAPKVKAAKKEAKTKTKTAAPKKAKTAVRALDSPITGGAALAILNALKKSVHTRASLAKAGETKESNINWYLNKIRNNGHKVERTDKGYKLTK